MYSNRKNYINLVDLIVKIIFAILFVFILMWLFKKNVPNMAPFYNNVFRENIKYMQEAGESYFTDDKMPKNVGETVKITLSEMFDKKLILPFVDEDGNSCNQYESYVSITKEIDETYSLKTNLVCNKERDYTIKVLGCHTYCKEKDCAKTCRIEKLTSYQYKKLVTTTKNNYTCNNGFILKDKSCYKTIVSERLMAEVRKSNTKTVNTPAIIEKIEGKKTQLNTIRESKRQYVDTIVTVTPSETISQTVSYTCDKQKTERKCSTTYVGSSYACNCTGGVSGGVPYTTCSTCYSSVPVETCKNVTTTYKDTCYKTVTSTTPEKTEYSCPAGTIVENEGTSNQKCYKVVKEYSCPKEANAQEGSGTTLKCYKVEDGSVKYSCPDNSYTLKGNVCSKTIVEESISYECNNGYKLEGKECVKYETISEKANVEKVTSSYYKYQWSTKNSISGWKKTGKTKTVNGKEICE